jgi:hypothetical protein
MINLLKYVGNNKRVSLDLTIINLQYATEITLHSTISR